MSNRLFIGCRLNEKLIERASEAPLYTARPRFGNTFLAVNDKTDSVDPSLCSLNPHGPTSSPPSISFVRPLPPYAGLTRCPGNGPNCAINKRERRLSRLPGGGPLRPATLTSSNLASNPPHPAPTCPSDASIVAMTPEFEI